MTENEMLLEVGSLLNFDPTSATADATQKARVVRAINQAKNTTLARLRFVNLKTSTFSTTASTMIYTPFADLDQIMVIRQSTSNQKLIPMPAWEFYNYYPDPTASGTPNIYIDQLGANSAGIKQIGLYPIPSATITMNVIYRGIVNDMTGVVDYTTGTAAVTNASATVTGSGTTWTAAMEGRYFRIDSDQRWYKILTRNSATSLTLAGNFLGSTASGAAYTISERFGIESQDNYFEHLIALKAKHLIAQTSVNLVDLSMELKSEYNESLEKYFGYTNSNLDEVMMLRPEGAFFSPGQMAYNLSRYDIYQ